MKPFKCGRCGVHVFFENVSCDACGAQLGFLPDELTFASFVPARAALQRVAGIRSPFSTS